TNSCGSVYALHNITVNPSPNTGVITGASSVCVAASTAFTSNGDPGVWSSGDASIATVDATGIVTGVSAGVVNITYTAANMFGSAYAIRSVVVNPMPVNGVISGPSSVCVGNSVSLIA